MGCDLLLVPDRTIFLINEDNRLVHDSTSPFEHPIRLSQPQAFISSETTRTRAIMTFTRQSSNIQSFYKLSAEERLRQVQQFAGLTDDELNAIRIGGLSFDRAERMVENAVGVFPIPLGIATNFLINNKDYLVPMAIEEPSVVAAASHAAKMARPTGGFKAESTEPIMIGQIQIVNCPDPHGSEKSILREKKGLIELANKQDPMLVSKGGGARDLRVRILPTLAGTMVVAELLVDCRDAMGANTVNTMVAALAPRLEKTTGGKVRLRIISNLADKRLARARVLISKEALGGEEVVDGIVEAYAFALRIRIAVRLTIRE